MKIKKWMGIVLFCVILLVGFYQGLKPLYNDITEIWGTVTQTETTE